MALATSLPQPVAAVAQPSTWHLSGRKARRRCCAAVRGDADTAGTARKGHVHLVGSGPGPPDLLTLRAVRLIATADVIVFDDLGTEAVLAQHASLAAELVYVGKRGGSASSAQQPTIDAVLVEKAAAGAAVVRLKGGDPAVFSRVHSEMGALSAAGIPFELVPGVSSALAAPLAAGFPLTHPQLSRAFAVASAHAPADLDWRALAAVDTLVLLMAGSTLAQVVEHLLAQGRSTDTPVAVVRAAGAPEERIWQASLASIVVVTAGERLSPCIVVVGEVAGWTPAGT